eukprot:scaffold7027_cov106-Isochrysis_galbana.AAC.1
MTVVYEQTSGAMPHDRIRPIQARARSGEPERAKAAMSELNDTTSGATPPSRDGRGPSGRRFDDCTRRPAPPPEAPMRLLGRDVWAEPPRRASGPGVTSSSASSPDQPSLPPPPPCPAGMWRPALTIWRRISLTRTGCPAAP